MMLQLICHILHIAATCISFGGLFYSRMVLIPNLKHIPEPVREVYLSNTIRRFGYIKWTGIVILAVTGIMQWFDIYPKVVDKTDYLIAFAIKMCGATGLLLITFLLSLPAERLKGMQRNRKFWSGLNLLCALIILIGAAQMRAIRTARAVSTGSTTTRSLSLSNVVTEPLECGH